MNRPGKGNTHSTLWRCWRPWHWRAKRRREFRELWSSRLLVVYHVSILSRLQLFISLYTSIWVNITMLTN